MTPTATTPTATEPPADLVITGCSVLTHDEQERIGFAHDAAIVVRDGVVESVTSAGAVEGLAAGERIDARGQVALPGLINCHTHAPMVAL
ncbi:5'-deoxyadenosine deaminase [Streptomyces sp. enrichment culture]